MKKNYIFILLLIIITILILTNSNIVIKSVLLSFNIWQNKVFPSLFPFLIIGNILIDLHFPEILGRLTQNIMFKVFKINGICSFILILSMLSGFPSSAKYITDVLNKGLINEDEASKMLTFTHFSNPLFILGAIATFLGSKDIAIIILICHYLGNIIIGLLFRNYYISEKKHIIISNDNKPFSKILSNSITSTINTLLYILGTITIFLIFTSIINNYLNIPLYLKTIINGILEMTQGLNSLSNLTISLNKKTILAISFISFGGLSVHMQIIGLISNTKIKYFPYFISRILHVCISSFLFIIWKILF